MLAFDDSPCWGGDWSAPAAGVALWAQSAVARTVRALPELHPLRLGDDKGTSGRVLAWCGVPVGSDGGTDQEAEGLGILTQLSPPPDLGVDAEAGDPFSAATSTMVESMWMHGVDLLTTMVTSMPREVADAVADAVGRTDDRVGAPSATDLRAYRAPDPGVRRWAGALVQIAGSWLPPVAVLPRTERDLDDPATAWSTESIDFASRHTVHASNVRVAADLLAPHVTALILDHVPDSAALTISGDAMHIWWGYDHSSRLEPERVKNTIHAARRIANALPSFVLADHPDHSQEVEDRLAARATEAAAYRAARDARLTALREQR